MEKTVTVNLDNGTVSIYIKDLYIDDATNLSVIVKDIADNVENALLLSKRHQVVARPIGSRLRGCQASQDAQ